MKSWLRRTRGAIGMGVTWALGWGVAGLLIGVASLIVPGIPFIEVFDAPLPALAIPGFFAGVFFSSVLAVAGRRRRFRELSLPRFAAWGALGGVSLTLFPFALVAVGLASREGSEISTGRILGAIGVPFVLLSALSATITLLIARAAERRDSRALDEDGSDFGLTAGEAHELLGAGTAAGHGEGTTGLGERARPAPLDGRADR